MNALDFYRRMVYNDKLFKVVQEKIINADNKSDEPCISMTYAELEMVNDLCYEYGQLMQNMMRNTQVENSEIRAAELPFNKVKEGKDGCGITETN